MSLNNENAFLLQMMENKRMVENAIEKISGEHIDLFPGLEEKVKMTETHIYIGLNDSETKKQIFETKEYVDTLKKACRNYHIAFSLDVEEGGYFHDDGEYTEETSLVLALIDADSKIVKMLAKKMCELFHQESVLVTESDIIGRFIRPDESE